jgi:hypothetical protein
MPDLYNTQNNILMAKIKFNPNQPIQSLSGSVGSISFRTINGHTHMYRRPDPVLPKNPTRKQRAQFKQRTLIDNCLAILQAQYEDIQEAIAMRPKIKERLRYLYKTFAPTIKAPTKLQKAIMTEYYARFSATSPVHSRQNPDTNPVHLREIATKLNLEIVK